MLAWGFCIVGLVLAFAVQRLQRHSFLDTLAGPREDKGRLAKLRLCQFDLLAKSISGSRTIGLTERLLFSGWPSEELAINALRFQAERAFYLKLKSDEESNWNLGRSGLTCRHWRSLELTWLVWTCRTVGPRRSSLLPRTSINLACRCGGGGLLNHGGLQPSRANALTVLHNPRSYPLARPVANNHKRLQSLPVHRRICSSV